LALALGALVCSGAAVIRPRAALAVEKESVVDAEKGKKVEKAVYAMTKFSNSYAKKTDTFFSQDPEITYSVIRGLAEHKVELGVPLCPCRFYEDKEASVKDGYWNCPCVPMRESGDCHCMLFLEQDNPFVGTTRDAQPEDVMKFAGDMP
jgi:ferredoxin-thioredoxin reductase catalytic chain